jgi:ascorbate-specific PTS system EIIC-type component UlaA
VLLLTLVTLGIYGIVYWWKVSKEVDVYAGRRNAHPITRTGLILMLVALPLYFIAFLAIFAGASTGVSSDMLGGFFVALILAFASGALLLAGGICLLIGEWRVWSTIRDHEFAVSAPKPLSPGLQLFFVLMPWLNVVTHWVALYKTQNHLNAMWENRTV